MSVLEVIGKPSNFESRGYVRMTSDVFNICERVAELDPNLRVLYNESNPEKPWVVTEIARDGEERFVAQYEALDARIIDDLQYMLRVPFLDRLKAQDAREEARKGKLSIEEEDQFEAIADRFEFTLRKAGARDGSGPNYRPVKRG